MNKKATWIWYFGDFEMYHHLQVAMSRWNYRQFIPSFWKAYDCNRCVRFKKNVNLKESEKINFTADGACSIAIDGTRKKDMEVVIPAGEHEIVVFVYNKTGIPAMFAEGKTIISDSSWMADNTMTYYGSHYKPVGYWNLDNKRVIPTNYTLPTKRIQPELIYQKGNESIFDFKKEVNIRLAIPHGDKKRKYDIYYGESLEEVKDNEFCVLQDEITVDGMNAVTSLRGCRYVRVVGKLYGDIYGLNQYLPKQKTGSFDSDSRVLNKIYNVSKYTYDLAAGLFFIEGLKRDGWVWSGDSFIANLCDFYYCFDKDIIKRNIIALLGRDPICSHVNGIVDFSFYLIISVGIYYMYTADKVFVENIYEKMKTLMEYCNHNLQADGFFVGNQDIWTFVDWADMNKDGAVCAIQILYCEALKTMSDMAEVLCSEESQKYKIKYQELKEKINRLFWSSEKNGYVTTRINGEQFDEIRRHANILAIIFEIADDDKKEKILKNVILNDEISAITTPFFSFFENDALCKMGQITKVRDRIEKYWGGMLNEGATTFWEEYDPNQKGIEKYEMYGRKFEKSLCHLWGASPLCLIGKYIVGVRPTKPGYTEFEVRPNLSGLNKFKATVPVNCGKVVLDLAKCSLKVCTDVSGGKLIYNNKEYLLLKDKEVVISF